MAADLVEAAAPIQPSAANAFAKTLGGRLSEANFRHGRP